MNNSNQSDRGGIPINYEGHSYFIHNNVDHLLRDNYHEYKPRENLDDF